MKLTADFSVLTLALEQMGTVPIEFDASIKLSDLSPIDIALGEGVEVNFEDIEFETGLASYQGRQVLLYIKDHSYNNKIYGVIEDGSKGNRFHVADCQKLEEMRNKGRLERYVVTNRLDGIFSVSGNDSETNKLIEGETTLNVCQYCLETINYQKFASMKRGALRRSFVNTFEMAEFWKAISKKIREQSSFQCQQCSLDLALYKNLLHVHHKNGVKSDNRGNNLVSLCCDCHRKQPDHQHMFVSLTDTKTIAQLRYAQGLDTCETWKDVYKIADPGMFGVIDLLEKYHVGFPDVGGQVKSDSEKVIAELALSWPLKKIGIAISKADAITATKLGWKIYSMRHALSQIEELVKSLR
jgi:hypothetical protein